MFISDRGEAAAYGFEEFAGAEEEIWVRGSAEAFVALRERFIEQEAVGGDGGNDGGQDGAMEVVGDDDRVEGLAGKRPGRAVFEVGLEEGYVRNVGKIGDAEEVAVEGGDGVAEAVGQAGVTAGAGCDV